MCNNRVKSLNCYVYSTVFVYPCFVGILIIRIVSVVSQNVMQCFISTDTTMSFKRPSYIPILPYVMNICVYWLYTINVEKSDKSSSARWHSWAEIQYVQLHMFSFDSFTKLSHLHSVPGILANTNISRKSIYLNKYSAIFFIIYFLNSSAMITPYFADA